MEQKFRVAVCDDDENALAAISSSLGAVFTRHGSDAAVSLFSSPNELIDVLQTRRFDLLLLDIDMPGLDGITLGHMLRERRDHVDIMFISSREDKVFDSLRVDPVGFIRKSRFLDDMDEVVGSYLEHLATKSRFSVVIMRERDAVYPVRVDRIVYIEGKRKKQLVHVDGQKHVVELTRTMNELEQELAGEGLIRIHKGYLVNYRYIDFIDGLDMALTTGERLPMSRRKERETKEHLIELVQTNERIIF